MAEVKRKYNQGGFVSTPKNSDSNVNYLFTTEYSTILRSAYDKLNPKLTLSRLNNNKHKVL